MKKNIASGIIVLLPLVATLFIVGWVINFFTDPFLALTESFFSKIPYLSPKIFAKISILMILLIFTLFIGFLAHHFFLDKLLSKLEILVLKTPGVKTIYSIAKDVFSTIFQEKSKRQMFKSPCKIAFLDDAAGFGFRTGKTPREIKEKLGNVTPVIIPSIHLLTGFLVFIEEDKITNLDISTEESIKWVLSCGTVLPSEIVPPMKEKKK